MQGEAAENYAIEWWKNRHKVGYFPKMDQHRDWRIYDAMPSWFVEHAQPKAVDHCLEIGCGYGEWMIPLSKMVATVNGFDIHPSILEKAREKFAEHRVENCRVTQGDGLTIPTMVIGKENYGYDLVYSISVFQHMPRSIVRRYMRGAREVLASTGRVLFHFRFAGGGGTWSDDITEHHRRDWSVGWTEAQIAEAAKEAGFLGNVHVMGQFAIFVGAIGGVHEEVAQP